MVQLYMEMQNLLKRRLAQIEALPVDDAQKLISRKEAIKIADKMSRIDRLFEESLTPLEIQLQEIDKLSLSNIEKLDIRQKAIEKHRDNEARAREENYGVVYEEDEGIVAIACGFDWYYGSFNRHDD